MYICKNEDKIGSYTKYKYEHVKIDQIEGFVKID